MRDAVAQHAPAGLKAHVGGTAAIFADVSTAVDKDLKIVFPVAAVLISLILLMLLRSLLAPAMLMIAVGLGFAATLGASTLFFQHVLDKPGVNFVLPLVLFLFVVALGTDYNILMSDRIREEMDRPGPARAVRHTAPAIATARVVLAASFGSLVVNAVPSTQQIGFATALGIMLSAFVLSIVLVPALAALLGRSTWWPIRPGRGQKNQHAAAPAGESYAEKSYAGQPYPGQPYGDHSYAGQSYGEQPYPGQPYQGQSYAGEPYPGQPRAHPPYYDDLNAR